jgi:hypothetical protein
MQSLLELKQKLLQFERISNQITRKGLMGLMRMYLTLISNGQCSVFGICRLPNEVESDLFSRRILPSTELILSEWVP